jgi:hypothetical protein
MKTEVAHLETLGKIVYDANVVTDTVFFDITGWF